MSVDLMQDKLNKQRTEIRNLQQNEAMNVLEQMAYGMKVLAAKVNELDIRTRRTENRQSDFMTQVMGWVDVGIKLMNTPVVTKLAEGLVKSWMEESKLAAKEQKEAAAKAAVAEEAAMKLKKMKAEAEAVELANQIKRLEIEPGF